MITLDLNDPHWFDFVCSCPAASPFHHPAWAALLAETYRYRPLVLTVTDGAGQITGGLPILDVSGRLTGCRWVSLPFTDYCPLLVKIQSAEQLVDMLIDEVIARKLDAFELRASLPAQAHLYARTSAVRHTLALSTNPRNLYDQFSKMHRRNIRKAERAGVRVELGRSLSDIQAFYHLHLLTRQRQGMPIQPRRFFRLLQEQVMKSGLGFVLTAHVNQVPVAAAVFLAWNGVLIYKYGASDQRFWEYRPNNLLFWEAIQWGCEHGYQTLDLGRSGLEDLGLREFKTGWGAREEPLIYSVIADAPPKPPSARLKKAMNTVIRHAPGHACQIIGELFYRYAA